MILADKCKVINLLSEHQFVVVYGTHNDCLLKINSYDENYPLLKLFNDLGNFNTKYYDIKYFDDEYLCNFWIEGFEEDCPNFC